MVLPLFVTGHECPKCGALWPDNMGALQCCDSWVHKVPAFSCIHCGLIFEKFEDAEACCQALDVVYVLIRDDQR